MSAAGRWGVRRLHPAVAAAVWRSGFFLWVQSEAAAEARRLTWIAARGLPDPGRGNEEGLA